MAAGAHRLEVAGGVLAGGAVVVVGPEDVDAGEVHQRAERVQGGGDPLRVGEVVAGVDHQVGPQAGEALQPALLPALAAHHVDVGDLQYPDGSGASGEDRDLDPAEAEGTDLVPNGVGEAGGAGGGDSEGNGVQRSHRSMLSDGGSAGELSGCARGHVRSPLGSFAPGAQGPDLVAVAAALHRAPAPPARP